MWLLLFLCENEACPPTHTPKNWTLLDLQVPLKCYLWSERGPRSPSPRDLSSYTMFCLKDWIQSHHIPSGLWAASSSTQVRLLRLDIEQLEDALMPFLPSHCSTLLLIEKAPGEQGAAEWQIGRWRLQVSARNYPLHGDFLPVERIHILTLWYSQTSNISRKGTEKGLGVWENRGLTVTRRVGAKCGSQTPWRQPAPQGIRGMVESCFCRRRRVQPVTQAPG